VWKQVRAELRHHAPFTAFGALTGVAIMGVLSLARVPANATSGLFWTFHPLHVLLSAVATASMFRLRGGGGPVATLVVGYAGSIGIATLSDSLVPYLGEWLLDLPNRGLHLGFVEMWWLVNPLALLGILLGWLRPRTEIPHSGHVLLSTWASLFHMTLATGGGLSPIRVFLVGVFLFLAVWLPCCASDIVFPLLFAARRPGWRRRAGDH
jgi:hypothetical protein